QRGAVRGPDALKVELIDVAGLEVRDVDPDLAAVGRDDRAADLEVVHVDPGRPVVRVIKVVVTPPGVGLAPPGAGGIDRLGEGEFEASGGEMHAEDVERDLAVPANALDAGAGRPAQAALALSDPEGAIGSEGQADVAGPERSAVVERRCRPLQL